MNEVYKPTIGSTPAMMENAIASGIKAKATTIPASIFLPGWLSHSFLIFQNHNLLSFLFNYIVKYIRKVSYVYPLMKLCVKL
jgi:hypothetical protein